MLRAISADVGEMLREQNAFRELLLQMTTRDLLLRYKQTVMGFGWAILMPLVNTAVFSVIFMRVAPISTTVPYPIFAYCGLWAWNFFASSIRFAVSSLTGNPNLISKVYFPREIFPFSSVIVCGVDFIVSGAVLVALMVWYRIPAGLALLWLPAILTVHVAFTAALCLIISMANLFYRDVKYLLEIVLTVWMFTTSVVYPVDRVGGWLGAAMRVNPMTAIIDSYRSVLLLNAAPPASLGITAFATVVVLALAWLSFHRAEFTFAERL